MLNWLRALLIGESTILANQAAIEKRTDLTLTEMKGLLMSNQDSLNALTEQLSTIGASLGTEFDALKAQIAAGTAPEDLDFSGVDNVVASLQALSDANTPAAPADPAPADPTPPVVPEPTA